MEGEWPSDYINDPFISESVKNDAAYSIALHNAYQALRQAVLDGEKHQKELIDRQLDLILANDDLIKLRGEVERYKAAGEALAKAVEEQAADTDYSLNHALTAFRTAIDDSSK